MGASKSLPLVGGNFSNKPTSFFLTCFNISTFPCKIGLFIFRGKKSKNHCVKFTTHSHIFVSYFCRSSTLQSSLKILLLKESKLYSAQQQLSQYWSCFLPDIKIEPLYRYVECTSSAVQGLALFRKFYPKHRRTEIDSSISNAIQYIEDVQEPDGSW